METRAAVEGVSSQKNGDTISTLMVTGGCGFIGSNFISHILETTDWHVLNYDSLVTGNKANVDVSDRYTLVVGDLCNGTLLDRTLRQFNVQQIVHFGALTHVTDSFKDPDGYVRANIQGTLSLLDTVRKYGEVKRFVHISTDEVYGDSGMNEKPKTETDHLQPTNPYSATKVGAEKMADVYRVSYNIPLCGLRMCNVYGPRQTPDKVIVKFIGLAMEGKPFTIEGDGQQLRSWLFVEDACRAIHTVLQKGVIGELYNIVSSNELSVLDTARHIQEAVEEWLGKPCGEVKTVSIPDRPYNDKRYYMDCSKLKENLGWSQLVDFPKGIKKTVAWYMNNSSKNPDRLRVLVYGSKGWIGGQFIDLLQHQRLEYVVGKCHIGDAPDHEVEDEILRVAPTHVAAFIGRTHGPGNNTVDFLEGGPDKLTINLRDNLFGPLLLAELCRKFNIHYTYIGSGCLFNYSTEHPVGGDPFTEDDIPNCFNNSYAVTKGFTDRLMHHSSNVLNIRIRIPISSEHHPRNIITKLANYHKILSIPNSVTALPDLLPALLDLMKKRHVGTVNLVNPGTITHEEILAMYKKYVDPSHTYQLVDMNDSSDFATNLKKKRSNCCLSTDVLSALCPEVTSSQVSVENAIREMGQKEK